jgi:uncharacterized protein YebE (UPF0316 family)
MLFFIGIIEMIVVTLWTKFVSQGKRVAGAFTTLVNIFIWYYVLRTITDDIENIQRVIEYALGCSVGTFIATGRKK